MPAEPPPTAEAFAAFAGRVYAADLIAEQQLAFVRAHAARPFFLFVPTTVPHVALQVPADEPSLVDYRRHFGVEQPYLGGNGYVPCQSPLATYAAMITRMDREVGRLVALLEELKLTRDTIRVFSSDNGAVAPGTGGIDTARLRSNGSLRDWKGSPHEGGLRVPTVAVWPGQIPAGGVIEPPTGFEDWLPTLVELAGLADRVPVGIDGRSLVSPLRRRAPAAPERMLYRELTEARWQAVVAGRWKAIRRAAGPQQHTGARPLELYDLESRSRSSRVDERRRRASRGRRTSGGVHESRARARCRLAPALRRYRSTRSASGCLAAALTGVALAYDAPAACARRVARLQSGRPAQEPPA